MISQMPKNLEYWKKVIESVQVPFDYQTEVQRLKQEQEKLEIINGIIPIPRHEH